MVQQEVSWMAGDQLRDGPVKAVSIDNGDVALVMCSNGWVYAYPFEKCASVKAPTNFARLWASRLHGNIGGAATSIDGTLVAVALVANETYPSERLEKLTTRGRGVESTKTPHLIEMYEIDEAETEEGFRFVCVYDMHQAEITSLALSPSGTHLASTDTSRAIFVMDVETGERIIRSQWQYHTMRVVCLDWSPDGTKLASGSLDQDVYVWDIQAPGRSIHIKDAHQAGVSSVQFIYNNVLLTAGADGVMTAYELDYEKAGTVLESTEKREPPETPKP